MIKLRNLFPQDFLARSAHRLGNQLKSGKKKKKAAEPEVIRCNYTIYDSANLEGVQWKMLQEGSPLFPQVSANGHCQRQDAWLAGPSQLFVIFISQNLTCSI